MPKFFTVTNTVCVVIAGFVVGTIIYVNTTTYQFGSEAPAVSNGDAPVRIETSLVAGCIDKTSKEIKAETGVTLGADDFRSSEVITHFKSVYGASNPWRT